MIFKINIYILKGIKMKQKEIRKILLEMMAKNPEFFEIMKKLAENEKTTSKEKSKTS